MTSFYPLVQITRRSDVEFSSILTKIANGESLNDSEIKRIEHPRQNVRGIDVERKYYVIGSDLISPFNMF